MQADIFTWSAEGERRGRAGAFRGPLPRAAHHQARAERAAGRAARDGEALAKSAAQVTYRMIVREVTEAKPPREGRGCHDRARLLAAGFHHAGGGEERARRAPRSASAPDAVKVECENTGNAYANPRGFALEGAAGEKLATRDSGGYILPGIHRQFDIKRGRRTDPLAARRSSPCRWTTARPGPSTSSSPTSAQRLGFAPRRSRRALPRPVGPRRLRQVGNSAIAAFRLAGQGLPARRHRERREGRDVGLHRAQWRALRAARCVRRVARAAEARHRLRSTSRASPIGRSPPSRDSRPRSTTATQSATLVFDPQSFTALQAGRRRS